MSLTESKDGYKYNELFIATQILRKEHEALLIAGIAQEVAHQLIAIRYLKDAYDISNGNGWIDKYTNRFDAIITAMEVEVNNLKGLGKELSDLEKEVIRVAGEKE